MSDNSEFSENSPAQSFMIFKNTDFLREKQDSVSYFNALKSSLFFALFQTRKNRSEENPQILYVFKNNNSYCQKI